MELAHEILGDFRGGMDLSRTPGETGPRDLAYLLNGRVGQTGGIRMREGYSYANGTALGSATTRDFEFGTEFVTAAGDRQQVAIVDGIAYYSEDNWASRTQITTGLATTGVWYSAQMEQGGSRYLILCNGVDTSTYTWDGTTWDTVSNIPDSVKFVAVHNNRLWAAGHSDNTVVASKIGDFNTWSIPDGISVKVEGDGAVGITGLLPVGGVLLVFKSTTTSYIDGYGNVDLVVAAGLEGVSQSVGCSSGRTAVVVGDQGAMWVSNRGLEHFVPGRGIQLVTNRFKERYDLDDFSVRNSSHAVFWPTENEYWLFPLRSSVTKLGALVYNLSAECFYRFMWYYGSGTALNVTAAWVVNDTEITSQVNMYLGVWGTTATGGGKVLCNSPDIDYDLVLSTTQVPVPMTARTGPLVFREPMRMKRARVIQLDLDTWDTSLGASNATTDLTVKSIADGSAAATHTTADYEVNQTNAPLTYRTTGRGRSLQVEVVATGGHVSLRTIDLGAKVYRNRAR